MQCDNYGNTEILRFDEQGKLLWSYDCGDFPRTIVDAQNHVCVLTATGIFALDLHTGKTVWRKVAAFDELTVNRKQVFVTDTITRGSHSRLIVQGFDESDGSLTFLTELPIPIANLGPAHGGLLLLDGTDASDPCYLLNTQGEIVWTTPQPVHDWIRYGEGWLLLVGSHLIHMKLPQTDTTFYPAEPIASFPQWLGTIAKLELMPNGTVVVFNYLIPASSSVQVFCVDPKKRRILWEQSACTNSEDYPSFPTVAVRPYPENKIVIIEDDDDFGICVEVLDAQTGASIHRWHY